MNPRPEVPDAAKVGLSESLFPAVFGALLGLAPVKFGNPPIMEKWVTAPTDVFDLVLGSPWPISWGYALLALAALTGVAVAKPRLSGRVPVWLLGLPAGWLLWQCLASVGTLNPELTKPTLAHFCACVVCFYLGFFCLAEARRFGLIWASVICAFLIVIAAGWQQHFGGLDQTRRYFFLYIYPRLREVPPEYIKKISSTRIFSTLFYPNALAGAVLLLLPPILERVWLARERFTIGARGFLVGAIGVGALGCLYWSGSKGGWLLMLVLALVWLLRFPLPAALKRGLVATLLFAGLAGFFWKYSGFFEKGATSVSARFDYWAAAVKTALAHPGLGTGPGTFSLAYQAIKRPESEMARLAHNDYLQQASDSGLPGFLLYSGFILGTLIVGMPARRPEEQGADSQIVSGKRELPKPGARPASPTATSTADRPTGLTSRVAFAIWLGVLGWALQGVMEFDLYMPGLAWPAFAFMGVLLGRRRPDAAPHALHGASAPRDASAHRAL